MHDAGIKFVVETARPVSTGYSFVQKLPVDAVAYLNGALLDFNPRLVRLRYAHLTDTAEGRTSAEDRILFEEGMRGLQVPAGGTAWHGSGHRHG